MRSERSLSGDWDFQLDPEGTLAVDALHTDLRIEVPMPWQVAFPELQRYSGYGWYSKSFELDEDWLDGEVILRLGAVDYWCQVFVNGQMAGEHEGGYTPVTLPIGTYLRVGRNEIAVRVYDSVQSEIKISRWPEYSATPPIGGPPFDANDIPHGKQEWYVNVGGIWQDVSITAVPRRYIESVAVYPDIHSGEALVRVRVGGEVAEGSHSSLRIEVNDSSGDASVSGTGRAAGDGGFEARVVVDKARLWNTSDPYLYTASITLRTGSAEDKVSVRFGFREIKTSKGQLLLNDEPVYLLAALDQDLYPETIYTVPSIEFLRDGFGKAKELGLNCLRCHIKPPDPRYLELADEMGLLIWAEIPSWRTFAHKGTVHAHQLDMGKSIKDRVAQTLEEMIQRDFNHPSLIIWTIINEDWGTALPMSGEDRAWVAEMYDYCKRLDPTRLVVDNSACPHPWGPNIHVKSDLDDFHMYANIPEGSQSFVEAVEQFGLRSLWTYSPHGDSTRTGQEPLILSEFGNWGLPTLGSLRDKNGRDPGWFEIGAWWSPWEGEAGWASGVEERFQRLGLDSIWRSYEEFAVATQWHQFAAMKYEIEALRRQPNIEGYVITEFTDAYWESNGLLDFNRNPKAYHADFAAINAPDMIIPQAEQYAYFDDQKFRMRPCVVRYSAGEWKGGQLRWDVESTSIAGDCRVPSLRRTEVEELSTQEVALPHVESARNIRLRLQLESDSGTSIAANSVDLLVLPASARKSADVGTVTVIARRIQGSKPADQETPTADIPASPVGLVPLEQPLSQDDNPAMERAEKNLERSLRELGYSTSKELTSNTRVVVSNHPDADLLRWVREGGDLLFLSKGASPFFWVQSRGGAYGGSWITSFSWIRSEIHKRLKAENPLGLAFMSTVPVRTILGLPVEDATMQGDFLAGSVSGWVRHPSIHTVQFRYGKGRVIMTTFALEENLQKDATAVAMLHDLLEHLCSDACQPTLTANY